MKNNIKSGLRRIMIKVKGDTVVIKPTTVSGLVQTVAGIFDLTPKESKVLAIMVYLCRQGKNGCMRPWVDKEMKESVAEITGHSLQVVTNYISKFKKKNVISKDNVLHSVFTLSKIDIRYEE